MAMITCRFSCDGCGLKDELVLVTSRPSEMDVVHWFEQILTPALAKKHRLLSPTCASASFKEVKIPLDKTEDAWIGKQTDATPPKE